MSGKKRRTQAVTTLISELRRPNLEVLGSAISSLPPSQWKARMHFAGAPDTDLRTLTGTFPATLRKEMDTHPIFVLEIQASGHIVCPCSSRGDPVRQRYIRQGCRLEIKGTVMDRNSYLVESCYFTMPLDMRFSRRLSFQGIVPANCIVTSRRKT